MIVYQLSHANNRFVAGKTTAIVFTKLVQLIWQHCVEYIVRN